MARPVKITDRNKRHTKRRSKSREETLGRRKLNEYFLIVTNGSETETQYFDRIAKKIPRRTIRKIAVDFQNLDPKGLVEYALEKGGGDYQHVAAVFDKDDFEHFNNAVAMMKAAAVRSEKEMSDQDKSVSFYTAYSNECFELWMLLHFQEINAALPRDSLFDKLATCVQNILEKEYQYDKSQFPFELLDEPGDQYQAIRRAKRLLQTAKNQNPTQPWTINPTTEVHELMEKLAEFMKTDV